MNKNKLTSYESLFLGIIGGTSETVIQMPLLTYKFSLQNNIKLPSNLLGWYRGVLIQSFNVAPITAFQMMSNTFLTNNLIKNREIKYNEKIVIASFSGGLSSLFYNPIDLITIQQQLQQKNTKYIINNILKQYNSLTFFKGLTPCVIRESIYAGGYLGMAPVISHTLQQHLEIDKFKTNIIGSLITGTCSSLITHPFDVVKTVIQSNLGKKQSLFPTMRYLLSKYGIGYLYKGGLPRVLKTCGAFYIYLCRRFIH